MTREVITLCGSTRFKEQFNDANFWLTMNGYIVLSVGSFLHSDNDPEIKDIIVEHKQELDVLHKDKIDMSRAIIVIDVDGYVGESTESEIRHALKRGKTIYSYMESKKMDGRLRQLVGVAPFLVQNWLENREEKRSKAVNSVQFNRDSLYGTKKDLQ